MSPSKRALSALAAALAAVAVVPLGAACGGPRASVEGPPPPAIYRPDTPQTRSEPTPEVRARELLDALPSAAPAEALQIQHQLLALGSGAHSALAVILLDDNALPVRRQVAALVLGEAGTADACATLTSAWVNRPGDWRVAVSIAVAAGRCGYLNPLHVVLSDSDDLDVRVKAAMALGLLGDSSAAAEVRGLFETAERAHAGVLLVAAALMGDHGAGRALGEHTESLLELPPDVAPFYAIALRRAGVGRDGDAEVLRTAATRNPDPIVRELALQYLAADSDPMARTLLTMALGDASPRVRRAAESLLAR